MRSFARLIIAAAATVAVSCSVYREYERPALGMLDSLYGYVPADTSSIAGIGWGDFFTDPCLQALIEAGLENNPDLLVARQRIIEANAALDAAGLAFLPSVKASPSLSYAYGEARYGGSATGWSVPLAASWEADINGRILNAKRKAAASAEQASVMELSVRTELVAAIARQYYTLLMLDAQLEVSRSTSASWKENVRIMKLMKEAGMTNEASVSHTEANSCSIEASLFDLEYKIRQQENSLSMLLGVSPRHFERSGFGAVAPLGESLACGVPVQLLSRRPDVMSAECELRKAYYDTRIAEAAFYPSLTISGELGWEKALMSPAGWLVSLGAGLVQPIFMRGTLKSNLTAAEARQESAAIAFREAILKAGAEVNDALALCSSAAGKAELRARQIEALEDAVASTEMLMRHSDSSTYLEVLTAQQALLSARLQQISDRYDAVVGAISLYKALGGGAVR